MFKVRYLSKFRAGGLNDVWKATLELEPVASPNNGGGIKANMVAMAASALIALLVIAVVGW